MFGRSVVRRPFQLGHFSVASLTVICNHLSHHIRLIAIKWRDELLWFLFIQRMKRNFPLRTTTYAHLENRPNKSINQRHLFLCYFQIQTHVWAIVFTLKKSPWSVFNDRAWLFQVSTSRNLYLCKIMSKIQSQVKVAGKMLIWKFVLSNNSSDDSKWPR